MDRPVIQQMNDLELRMIKAHFESLERQFWSPTNEENTILLSGHLRFLLVDGGGGGGRVHRAWKHYKFQGPFLINTFRPYLDDEEDGLTFSGGGGPGFVDLAVGFKGAAKPVTLNLRDFVKGNRIISRGTSVSTEEVIQYFANKMGGVHFDQSRKNSLARKYLLLDRLLSGEERVPDVRLNDRHPVHHEMFCIAGALLNSPSISKLLAKISGYVQ